MSVVQGVYARALHDAARDRDRVAEVRGDLAAFVQAVRSVPELRSALRNPQLEPRAKAAALEALVEGADELVRNFLRLLAEKGRAGQVEEIGDEFERLVAAEEGQLTVELTTARELSEQEAEDIVRQIEEASGRHVEATRRVDPSLIGGIVLQAGSRRADASVRGRLERLRQELATGA
jgi:F-type H+-transporting ATPase subunit delta